MINVSCHVAAGDGDFLVCCASFLASGRRVVRELLCVCVVAGAQDCWFDVRMGGVDVWGCGREGFEIAVAAATESDKDDYMWDSGFRVLGINVFSCCGCRVRQSQLYTGWHLLHACG